MTVLSTPVITSGVAKNKILAILGVFGAILISALMFGVLTVDGEKKIDMNENIAPYHDDSGKNTDQLLQDILAKKQASSVLSESHIILPANVGKSQTVPPIIPVNKEPVLNRESEIDVLNKQIAQTHAIFSAKSLMFIKATASLNNTQPTLPENSSAESIPKLQANSKIQSASSANPAGTDYLASNLTAAKSQYELMAGSIIPATMLSGLNSDLPGQVIAQVRENVYDSSTGKYLLIPQGAKLVGLYDSNIAYGQERILVAWNRLIYGDGSSINLRAMPGTDLEGYTGLSDGVDNKYWKLFGSSFIMGVITAAMQYSQNNTNANVQSGGIGVTTNSNPTVGQTLSGSLGQQLGQTGLSLTQKNLNVQPTLIVKPNYPFNIMITADIILHPLAIK